MVTIIFSKYPDFKPNISPAQIDELGSIFFSTESFFGGGVHMMTHKDGLKVFRAWYKKFHDKPYPSKENPAMIEYFNANKNLAYRNIFILVKSLPEDSSSDNYKLKLFIIQSYLQSLLEIGVFIFNPLNPQEEYERFKNDARNFLHHFGSGTQR